MANKKLGIIFYVFALIGSLILVGAVWLGMNEYKKDVNGIKALAVISDIDSYRSDEGNRMYTPIYTFVDEAGVEREVKSSVSSSSLSYDIGDQVEVIYMPGNYQGATINTFLYRYLFVCILSVFGIVFFLVGGAPLFFMRRKSKRHAKLLETGVPIKTQFNRVIINRSLRVNGESPYVIVTHGRHPKEPNTIKEFKSSNIWFNPEPYIFATDEFTVYVDPDHPKYYAMDTSHLTQQVT